MRRGRSLPITNGADWLPQAGANRAGPEASAKEGMAHRLKTATGRRSLSCASRRWTGLWIIKEVMGFRRFLLRGRAKVELEWTLVCVSYNFKRRFTLKNLFQRDKRKKKARSGQKQSGISYAAGSAYARLNQIDLDERQGPVIGFCYKMFLSRIYSIALVFWAHHTGAP